jgi:pimeloyl-ACP methyl ester carboxylesterase
VPDKITRNQHSISRETHFVGALRPGGESLPCSTTLGLFPSPLWGGARGGGTMKTKKAMSPPPPTPPHTRSANALLAGEGSASSPLRTQEAEPELEPDRTGTVLGLSLSGFHHMAYVDWGPAQADIPVLCVHGLSRQGRDFDYLAAALAGMGRRVVCPDLAGRGQSGRLRNPDEYALPQYCADINALVARLGAEQVDFVGTSLGGLIGMVLAGLPGNSIRRLVINDIGPFLPWQGLARIGSYVAAMPADFRHLGEVEAYFREVLAPFGDLPDAHWAHITRHSVAWHPSRERYIMLCDPQIVRAFRNPWHYSLDLWKYWTAIKEPILVTRGVESDLLPADLAGQMVSRNTRTTVVEFQGCGHAPPLMSAEQIAPVAEFLNRK